MTLGVSLELFEGFGGAGNGLLVALHVDVAVSRGDAHPQRVPNSSHMLIACAEERDQFLGTDYRDVCFTHPNRAGTPADAPTHRTATTHSITNRSP